MGEFDFEAEARAIYNITVTTKDVIGALVRKLRENDARARDEGKAEGYRRGRGTWRRLADN